MGSLRRVIGLALAGGIAFLVVARPGADDMPAPAEPVDAQRLALVTETARPAMSARFVDLRNEGIENVGWIAGNARGHPIWPEVRGFVEPGGVYYDAFMRLSSGGDADDAAEAAQNVARYRQWKDRGAAKGFDQVEAETRIRRMIAIAGELTAEMKR